MQNFQSLFWIVISILAIKISSLAVGISQDIYLFIVNIYQLSKFVKEKLIFLLPEIKQD